MSNQELYKWAEKRGDRFSNPYYKVALVGILGFGFIAYTFYNAFKQIEVRRNLLDTAFSISDINNNKKHETNELEEMAKVMGIDHKLNHKYFEIAVRSASKEQLDKYIAHHSK